MTEEPKSKFSIQRTAIVCLVFVIGTIALFFPATSFPFIGYDDPFYVVSNPHVLTGLNWDNVTWAFTSLTSGFTYWHPISWMSHMLDCQLFGLDAGKHHLMNILFHCVNVGLLFVLLQKLTGAFWRSAAVAAIFAWHPLQVETVAWVTERKNLLSTMFLLLTIFAYLRYVKGEPAPAATTASDAEDTQPTETTTPEPSPAGITAQFSNFNYWLPVILFALGLMSKPMLVTVPLVLLLLDFWPLNRVEKFNFPSNTAAKKFTSVPTLLIEKIPYFILSAISAGITVLSHEEFQSLASSKVPLAIRFQNALYSYARYIKKALWPNDLALVYPFPTSWPMSRFLICFAVVAIISVLALWLLRRRPYVAFGWLWFLITLLPVIGLIQAGSQAMADRFAYVPLIGLLIMVVWGLGDLLSAIKIEKMASPILALLVFIACAVTSRAQLQYWKDSIALFEHSVAIEPDSAIAQFNLGYALQIHSRAEDAKKHFEHAIEISSTYFSPLNNLAAIYAQEGKVDDAIALYSKFLQKVPNHPEANMNLAIMLQNKGNIDEALKHFRAAIEANPKNPEVHLRYGNVLGQIGKGAEATQQFEAAVQVAPTSADARLSLGNALLQQQKPNEAIQQLNEAVKLKPDSGQMHYALGNAYATLGQFNPAMQEFMTAAKLSPKVPDVFMAVGAVFEQLGKGDDALRAYERAVDINPDFLPGLMKLGWAFCSHPNPKMRNGPQALLMAKHAVEMTHEKNADALDLLGAAYAETGQFAEASVTAQKAIDLANAAGNKMQLNQIQAHLQLYKQERAFPAQ